jgi:toxin ParE1/3/4
MSRYIVARRARVDLEDIWGYIAIENDRPNAADRLMDSFFEKFALLGSQPQIREQRPDLDDLIVGVRSFTVGNYVIYYQTVAGGVRIGRVLHGARDVRSALGD